MRAALAKIFLGRALPELVILDEPTNDLDFESLDTLERALAKFKGALLLVSHDRVFCERLAPDIEVDVSTNALSRIRNENVRHS